MTRREAGDCGDVGAAGAEIQGVSILEDILIAANNGAEAQGDKGNCGGAGADEFWLHRSCAGAEWASGYGAGTPPSMSFTDGSLFFNSADNFFDGSLMYQPWMLCFDPATWY